jgi:plasmid stabilization system protein ParE
MNEMVILQPAARQDFLDAHDWYEQQRDGLGRAFESAVDQTLEMISASPESFPTVHRDIRRALVRPFPYGVFYRIRGQTIHVFAVMHGRREPTRWISRTTPD